MLLLALGAGDGGVDLPRIVHLEPDYLVNEAAFRRLDVEVRRLQELERVHKAENWFGVLFTGMVVGALISVAVAVPIVLVANAKKNPPSP